MNIVNNLTALKFDAKLLIQKYYIEIGPDPCVVVPLIYRWHRPVVNPRGLLGLD